MDNPKHFKALLVLITISFQILETSSTAQNECLNSLTNNCPNSSCNNILNISFPFQLESQKPISCSSSYFGFDYRLFCKENRTVLCLNKQEYYVEAISYHNYTIRVVSADVREDDCSSIPSSSLSAEDIPRSSACQGVTEGKDGKIGQIPEALQFSSCEIGNCSSIALYDSDTYWGISENSYFETKRVPRLETVIRFGRAMESLQISETLIFLSCEKPMLSNPSYIDTSPCLNSSKTGGVKKYSYVVYGNGFKFSDMDGSCRIYRTAVVSSPRKGEARKTSYSDIHTELVRGFELSWVQAFDKHCEARCYIDEDDQANKVSCSSSNDYAVIISYLTDIFKYYIPYFNGHRNSRFYLLLAGRAIGFLFLIALIAYKWRTRHISEDPGIEAFLRSSNNTGPLRYKYSEIKKMAGGFKTKLGQGGFGSVYKGKLRSGRFAAIKILSNAKGSGDDFINEVGTIGRIRHVNVVRLIGFCVEGTKRALIYDFMPNGSLDKYIFSEKEGSCSLSCEEIFEISLGVARGIEYLHRGCDMQILHFDIKPHNILLDENFVPKVSDFGLARLCPLDDTGVSLTAARGTIGYIAPELFYKNIGGVSHKSDVYSFGMLLMEMANRRRNINPVTEGSSEVYFPLWIYDQFNKKKSIEIIENVEYEETKATKKMIIVALWCIQLKPCDRPSMKKVIEMLEGEVELLQMPPKPYLYPQESFVEAEGSWETSNTSSLLSEEDSPEISLLSNTCLAN